MSVECPLCLSRNNRSIELLEPDLLPLLYKRRFRMDVPEGKGQRIELRVCYNCDLQFYHPMVVGEEKFYESLQRFDWYYLTEKEEYDIAARHVTDDSSLLEVGVGYGEFAKRIKTKSYVGLELSDSAVATARRRGLRVYKSSVEAYAAKHKEEYDVVCAFQVLEHMASPRSFIEASLKCLKPGGRLIQSVPSENSFMRYEVNNILNMPPHHATRWTDSALRKLGELFELTVLEIRHDTLSERHLRPYAITQIRKLLNRICGRQHRLLDPQFAKLPARVAVRGLSFLPEMYLRFKRSRPAGHSVTAVYVKT
jgi:SAM-dependent methyltransferase